MDTIFNLLEQGHNYSLINQYGVSILTDVFEVYMLQVEVNRRNYYSYIIIYITLLS